MAATADDPFFDINEFGGNIRLNNSKIIFYHLIPIKLFQNTCHQAPESILSATSQTNIGLDKQTFTGILTIIGILQKR